MLDKKSPPCPARQLPCASPVHSQRARRIAQLKSLLRCGLYRIDDELLAERMLQALEQPACVH